MLSETSSTTEYTLPGVLHYLQVEWRRFERERNEWAIERAELKVVKTGARQSLIILKDRNIRHALPYSRVKEGALKI